MASTAPDIAALKTAVDSAVAASRRPPTLDAKSWPFRFPQQHLEREAWRLVWDLVRYVRRTEPDLHRQFLHARSIADFTIDFLAQAAPGASLEDVLNDLRSRASSERSWLIDIPLMNLVPPRETVPLSPGAMLVRSDWSRRHGRRFGSYLNDVWAIKKHLGDELTPRDRWLRESGTRGVALDTRKMASLLLVEEATEEIALSTAESRARLVIAMWCLLSPPRSQFDGRPIWPTVGGWTPAPSIEFGIQRKPFEPGHGFGRAQHRGNRITEHAVYKMTRSDSYLRAPFAALEEARQGNQCALALLSAARSLYLAAQIPNDLDRTERIMFVWRAREALAHPGPRKQPTSGPPTMPERWRRLVVNLRLRSDLLHRGYDAIEIDEAFAGVESLRHLATHLADDVLVNLDYPPQMTTRLRRATIDSRNASLAAVAADWPLMLNAVQIAARRLVKGAIRNGWDEAWFHSRFR